MYPKGMIWRPPAITSDNLRWLIREAPAGAEIELPPGEFEGPFVFDRPLRLTAQGNHPEAVTLWTRRGPTVVVRSPRVSLSNLSVEVTFKEAHQNTPTVWYAAGCQPDTRRAQIQGKVTQMGTLQNGSGWKLPDLIDLGDLRAKFPVSLPMVIRVPGPTNLRGELADLEVYPTRLPAKGEYQIQVWIREKQLLKNTMLAGQLVLESGGETRSIWIIGRVLEKEFKAWLRDKLILIGQSGRKFGFGNGILLGKEQLRGERGASKIAEKQAYITKEASGVWTLIQPLPVSPPTLLNRQPVGVGQRLLLKGGEVIKVGKLKLTVETKKTTLPVTVQGMVDFGKLSTPLPSPPAIKVLNDSKFKKWKGTLRSTVSWIQVPQPQVSCPRNQTVQIPVQLTPDVSSLPKQDMTYTGALVLEGAKESFLISAHIVVDVDKRLEVEPTALDFGEVSEPSTVPTQNFRIRNMGNIDWQGTVQVAVPWLAVDKTNVQCAAGADTMLTARLTNELATLSTKLITEQEAIKIEGEGLSVTLAVQLKYNKPFVQLDVQPRALDFGSVQDWRTATPETIEVVNTGTKAWQGHVDCQPWLDVTPSTFQCPVQGQTNLTVRLTDQFQKLTVGEQKVPAAIRLMGEGVSKSLLVRLEVEALAIVPNTTSIHLILADRSALPRYTLRLQNQGLKNWRGTVKSTLRWLVVSPTDVTCPAGGQAEIDVTLDPQMSRGFKKPRTIKAQDAIQIESGGQPLLIGVQLEIKAPPIAQPPVAPPPKVVARPARPTVVASPSPILTVDFGTVKDWRQATREIRLTNNQPWVMNGTARSTLPWLAVTPSTFSVPRGQELVLTATLTKEATSLQPRTYEVPDAVIIESGSEKLLVKARLQVAPSPSRTITSHEPKTPPQEPQQLTGQRQQPNRQPQRPFLAPSGAKKGSGAPLSSTGLAVDFGMVSDWRGVTSQVRLPNRQNRTMNGTARSTLPWLAVTPSTFSVQPGQELVLTATLTNQATSLRPKAYKVNDAVIIESGGQQYFVQARLQITRRLSGRSLLWTPTQGQEPSPQPSPQPARLPAELKVDFGTISDWSGPLPTHEIRLTNNQPWVMTGIARSQLLWLAVTPTTFSVPPRQELVLIAMLTKDATNLQSQTYQVEKAIIISSGSEQHFVKAGLVVDNSNTRLLHAPQNNPSNVSPKAPDVNPRTINFGVVDRSAPLPTIELNLSNSTGADWHGTIRSTVPWLSVTPTEITCFAGRTIRLSVRLTKRIARLRRNKTYTAPDTLVIEGGGHKLLVEAQLTLK